MRSTASLVPRTTGFPPTLWGRSRCAPSMSWQGLGYSKMMRAVSDRLDAAGGTQTVARSSRPDLPPTGGTLRACLSRGPFPWGGCSASCRKTWRKRDVTETRVLNLRWGRHFAFVDVLRFVFEDIAEVDFKHDATVIVCRGVNCRARRAPWPQNSTARLSCAGRESARRSGGLQPHVLAEHRAHRFRDRWPRDFIATPCRRSGIHHRIADQAAVGLAGAPDVCRPSVPGSCPDGDGPTRTRRAGCRA